MEFMTVFPQKTKKIKVRCIECFNMHQEDKSKEHYFCLKFRDYINHEIFKKIECNEFNPLDLDQLNRY
jgi:hypothetical protein